MKSLAICTLYFALIAAASTAGAEPKSQYGDFSSDTAGFQAFRDYIIGLEMIKVEAGAELQQAVEAIPVEVNIPITPEQEADLCAWLYDFLVAFSSSGSDSLAVAFYTRGGLDLGKMERWIAFLKGDTPKEFLQTAHRKLLDSNGRDYYFEKASFLHSTFTVFTMQDEYASYQDYAQTHGMTPGAVYSSDFDLQQAVEKQLKAGEQRIFAQFMFIAEEPEESADFEKGPGRTPCFLRLVWDPKRTVWRPVEAFFNSQVRHEFLFNVM